MTQPNITIPSARFWITSSSVLLLSLSTACERQAERIADAPPTYPLKIAWVTDVAAPVSIYDAPDIVYSRTGDVQLTSVSWRIEFLPTGNDAPAPARIDCPVPVHIPGTQGTITGDSGKWTEVVALFLSYFMSGGSGHAELRFALVEPEPLEGATETREPRQLSNWLTLPIIIGDQPVQKVSSRPAGYPELTTRPAEEQR